MENLDQFSNHLKTDQGTIRLNRIPDKLYADCVTQFFEQYHFQNGERMRLANYYVTIDRSLSDTFVDFIKTVTENLAKNQYPPLSIPNGFRPPHRHLLSTEARGGFSFGSFDMAVTMDGLQNIEFQSVATYPISAAKLNLLLLNTLNLKDAVAFADSPDTTWETMVKFYQNIIAGEQTDGIVLADRHIKQQKTNFEFFATQEALNVPVHIVDIEEIFEKEGGLFFTNTQSKQPIQIRRLYNRVLIIEALFEDHYPENENMWRFRFDRSYQSLKFINHPIKQFEVSKRLSPYIEHRLNPECFELSAVVEAFQQGKLAFEDYVWKHKWGAAGHHLILTPTRDILESLSPNWGDYIAQKKINFAVFKTDDGQKKIVELRFMTAHHNGKIVITPMARLGHVVEDEKGRLNFKIHFGDNNQLGYGFCPVVIEK